MIGDTKIAANHSMAYFVAADSYSDLRALRSAGIIDAHLVIHGGGVYPPSQFVVDCNAVGLSPVLNNGNDGSPGWDGSDGYYANVASLGYHAAGGESEQGGEIDSIMRHCIFMDYGGQGTAGGTNDDVWSVTHPGNVSGYGAAGYYETYDASSNFWGWDVVGSGMLHAKSHGVKEIGIMVGSWMMGHSSAQNYIQLAQDMESNGIKCAGMGVWSGYGNNMNSVYNEFASWYQEWMSIWPATNITMKNRYAGVTPPPPGPTHITMASSPAIVGDTVFIRGSDSALWWKIGTGKWTRIGGVITSAPCARQTTATNIDVYIRGGDGSPYHLPIIGTKTGAWNKLTGQIQKGTNPAISNTGELCVIGTDGAVWKLVGGKWTSLGKNLT